MRLCEDPVQLPDVTEGEGSQKDPERRRRHHPVTEDFFSRSRSQHVGVIDVRRPCDHGVDQGEDLATRKRPTDTS